MKLQTSSLEQGLSIFMVALIIEIFLESTGSLISDFIIPDRFPLFQELFSLPAKEEMKPIWKLEAALLCPCIKTKKISAALPCRSQLFGSVLRVASVTVSKPTRY